MKNLIENSGLVFSLAIIIGLILPQFSGFTSSLITILLIIAMSLSLRQIRFSKEDVRPNLSASVKAFLLNYIFLSSVILISAYFLIPNPDYFAGFVIMAAVPPAIAVVPFTYLLKGDTKASLGGEILCYLLALAVTPLITLLFIGTAVNIFEILYLLVLLIIAPLIISRMLCRLPGSYFSASKSIVNICFALITYAIVGINQTIILFDFLSLMPLFFILFLKTFVTGVFIYLLAKKIGSRRERAISYSLFASYKNGGMTAAFSLILIGAAASLPATIEGIFELLFIIFLQFMLSRS